MAKKESKTVAIYLSNDLFDRMVKVTDETYKIKSITRQAFLRDAIAKQVERYETGLISPKERL